MNPTPPVWLRFTETVEPTATNPQRYEAGSVWHVPIDRAEALLDAGQAELCDPPAAATRVVTEPLEPLSAVPHVPAPAVDAAAEEE